MKPLSSYARLPRRQAVFCLLGGLSIALVVGLGGVLGLAPVARLDRLLLDTLLVRTASGAPASDTVVVDIDEVSLSQLGQWPWPRYRVAQLIERIAANHPSAIAMDIVFPEADRSSLADIRKTFKRDFGIEVSFNGVPTGLLDNDGYLGHVMAHADVVGARYFYFDHTTRTDRPTRPGVGFTGRVDLLSLEQASGVLDNVDAIASQTRVSGFVNSRLDADGVLRRLPLLIQYDGVVHPSLALAASMRSLGVSSGRVESGVDGLSIQIGSHRIPVDQAGYALLRFNGPSQRYASFSAVDVLGGRVRPADLRGKIVFIGSSAVGLHDVHPTAVERDFSGLKIQSVMAQNILDDHSVRVPVWGSQAALLLGLLAALVLSILFITGRGLVTLAAFCVLSAAALIAMVACVFVRTGLFIPAGVPLLVLVTLFVLSFVIRFAINQRRAQRWRRQLENARQVAIESMAAVAETRDPETGAHIKRTQHYVRAVAEQLQRTGHHAQTLTREYIDLLFLSAPLHDIGKVGVPDHILLKPGPLTPAELVIMRQHAEFGRKIIYSMADHIEGDNFLLIAGEIAATHHEKWDGTGYPDGLRGQAIPLSGRIMAVADIYDALISRRCYKDPFPHARAKALMHDLRETTFDPEVLDAFFAIDAEMQQIAARFRDREEDITGPAWAGLIPT
ncbi:MAG TPA: CHASE2 domain-containing protein [Rhodanobacter sp.]|nr:CHASE2 domain-containing protein [Rhodanobacter sp.]